MLQYADWSQHATHWYPTVRCCNVQAGHNTSHTGTQPSNAAICRLVTCPHIGTQLSDAVVCRLVTTRHTLVPNCWMWQYADWSQHATCWYPTARCCNMQTGDNMSHIGTQPPDAAIRRLVTSCLHIGTQP